MNLVFILVSVGAFLLIAIGGLALFRLRSDGSSTTKIRLGRFSIDTQIPAIGIMALGVTLFLATLTAAVATNDDGPSIPPSTVSLTTEPPTTTTSTPTTTTTVAPQVTVPDIVGHTESEAKDSLEAAGLTPGEVAEEFSEADPGRIIATDPEVGAALPPGSTVDLVVAKLATPDEVYLAALFGVGIEDSRLAPGPTTLAAELDNLERSVNDHATRLESEFVGSYQNQPPDFVPAGYAPDAYGIDVSDLKSDAAKLATALAELEIEPPEAVAILHASVVAEAGAIAASASEVDDFLSSERVAYPSARRLDRRQELVVLGRDLAEMRMDLGRICAILQPDHPACAPIVGDDPGPDPAVGIYLKDLNEIGARVERLDERTRVLLEEWQSAVFLIDRADYLTMLANEGLWRVLGYAGDNDTEAQALGALANRLVAPDGSAVVASHDDLLSRIAEARAAIEEMANSFLHREPRPREQALNGVAEALAAVLDAIAEACSRAGTAYAACSG